MKCVIRRVNIADPLVREQLYVLHQEAFKVEDWVGGIPKFKTGDWFIAFAGRAASSEPLGFAGLLPSVRWEQTGYLCSAGVLPQYRGSGLQKALIWRRIARAQELGWHTVITETICDNVPSMRSLIACGFRPYQPKVRWNGSPYAVYWRRTTLARGA